MLEILTYSIQIWGGNENIFYCFINEGYEIFKSKNLDLFNTNYKKFIEQFFIHFKKFGFDLEKDLNDIYKKLLDIKN